MIIRIDGLNFEMTHTIRNSELEKDMATCLYDCYKKPSQRKMDVYKCIREWFGNHNGECGIHSYNHHIITIAGYIVVNGIQIGILFTHYNNYFFQLEREF